jgi:hypothetical protein
MRGFGDLHPPLVLRALRPTRLAALVAALPFAGACGDGPASPSGSAVVTFRVVDETFRVRLTTAEQVAAARAAMSGGRAKIPNGRIVAGTDVNTGWSWHLEDVTFAEITIEVCDGRPSDVERAGAGFGGGRYCPWSALVVEIKAS